MQINRQSRIVPNIPFTVDRYSEISLNIFFYNEQKTDCGFIKHLKPGMENQKNNN